MFLPGGGGKCVEMSSTNVAERKAKRPHALQGTQNTGAETEQSCHPWRGQDTAEGLLAPKQSERGVQQAGSMTRRQHSACMETCVSWET